MARVGRSRLSDSPKMVPYFKEAWEMLTFNAHRIHGTGIFTYMKTIKKQANVGKYTSPMEGMGMDTRYPRTKMDGFQFSV